MESPPTAVPVVVLPERVDRRIRFGPFPSARDALKFVCYASVGAVLAPFATPLAWLPVLGAGFAVSVWRSDGEALDERAGRYAWFHLHRGRAGSVMPADLRIAVHGSVARLASGARVTVVRTGGVPLAYRPPAELAALFERFRELIRATEGTLLVRATTAPLSDQAVRPRDGAPTDADAAARAGYRELASVLCRRRHARRVELSIATTATGPEAEQRLMDRTRALEEQLTAVGVRAEVLAGRQLGAAAHRFGWALARTDP
jgi:hypothetical protein